MSRSLDALLPPADQTRVVEAIRVAERKTSGEIKVHLEDHCPGGDAYARATHLFQRLGLTATRERNAVLIYVALGDRKFALLGDVGIHEEVGAAFWAEAVTRMQAAFARGATADALVDGVQAVAGPLARRFPPRADDRNELSDELSHDEGPERP